MIEVKQLVKQYGNHVAVDHASFRVETGKIVGFLGPNGAGKSTTMNMITGYIAPTQGQVIVDGIDIEDEPERAKRNIGYLPEQPPLYPDMRVREYLYFVAELKKVPGKQRGLMVAEIMESTGITEMSERLIRHLSKGYKQRVGLAGAMMGYPQTLILDEPTVGLDPGQIIQMRDLIRELSKEHTILLSSHIMQEISAVCDEIIIINEGKIIAIDTPENLTMQMASNGLHLIIRGDEADIKNALRTVRGIKNVVYDEIMEESTLGLTLYSIHKKDLREELFFALAEAGCPLLEMQRVETTLEEAFLALTSGQREEASQKAEASDAEQGPDELGSSVEEDDRSERSATGETEESNKPGVTAEEDDRSERSATGETEESDEPGTLVEEDDRSERSETGEAEESDEFGATAEEEDRPEHDATKAAKEVE